MKRVERMAIVLDYLCVYPDYVQRSLAQKGSRTLGDRDFIWSLKEGDHPMALTGRFKDELREAARMVLREIEEA